MFGFHATVAADFLHGGYYPIGGSKEIAIHAARVVEQRGGECLVNHAVKEIKVSNGRACGVTAVVKGQEVEFTAPLSSNAGAVNTFGKTGPRTVLRFGARASPTAHSRTVGTYSFLGIKR